MLPYGDLECRWRALGAARAAVREVACVGAPRTLLVAQAGNPAGAAVSIAAGIHGDEPGACGALLSVVESGLLDDRFSFRLWPCTNPSGYAAGTRENAEGDDINRSFSRGGTTPEAKAMIAANRDRKFALSIDLHEDVEASGFYCYEPYGTGRLGATVVRAVEEAGFPIQVFAQGFDVAYRAEAVHLHVGPGLIVPDVAAEEKHFSGLTYSLYLGKRAARHALTFEAPGMRDWKMRIAILRVAVVAALAEMLKVSPAVDEN